jgi:Type I restriction modification DNA specificity domain
MKFYELHFSDIATHKDLRCGLGLILFRQVVNRLIGARFPSVKLGDILTLEYGKGLTDEERMGEGYPVVGSNGVIGYHDEYLIEAPCIIVGRKGSAGEVTYLEQPCFPIDTTFYVKQKTDFFKPKILFYLLRLLNLQNLALFKGVPGLNRHDAYEVQIPLIARDVQEILLRQIEPREREIMRMQEGISDPTEPVNKVFEREFGFRFDKLKRSVRDRVFSVPFSQLAAYRSLRCDFKFHLHMPLFSSLISRIGNSVSLEVITTDVPVYGANEAGIDGIADADIRYIRITDIDALGNLLTEEWKTAQNIEPQYILQDGDFLFARSGNTVGKTFLYNSELHPEALFAGYFIKFKLNSPDFLPTFLLYYTKSFIYDTWVKGMARVKGQPNINADEYLELRFPILPLPRQEKIIAEIQAELAKLDEVKRQIEAKRSEIDHLIETAISVTTDDAQINN